MPFPPLPIENLGQDSQNIHSLFLYLQRLRDLVFDQVITVIQSEPVVIVDIVATTFQDTATISVTIGAGPTFSFNVNDLSITEAKLADLSVSTAKLQNLSVIESKLAALSVSTAKVQDLAITEAKLDNLSVATSKLQLLAVTSAILAADSVITSKILNANVTYAKIQNVAASRLLGNSTGSAATVEEISIGVGLTLSSSTLNTSTQSTRVSSQFDKTTNTTLSDITGLTATLVVSGVYTFEARLFFDASALGGSKFSIAGTSTATSITFQTLVFNNTAPAVSTSSRQTALAASVSDTTVTAGYTLIQGTIVAATAGTLTVQFAQAASSGTSSILVNSSFTVERIG